VLLLMISYNTLTIAAGYFSGYQTHYGRRSSGCRDDFHSCGPFKSWCRKSYGDWVRQNCKKTCGLCRPAPTPKPTAPCTDKKDFANLCHFWKFGNLCHSAAYVRSMRYYCAKTCGFCTVTIPVVKPKPTSRACGRDKPGPSGSMIGGKVVNGNDALPHQWEWQGGLYYKDFLNNPKFVCGGSLIEKNVFLTAAHCVDRRTDERRMIVRLGDHDRNRKEDGEQDMKVKKIIIHERWDRSTNQNDIAILQLEQDAEITDTVGTVCLASNDIDPRSDPDCWITGWGKTGEFQQGSTVLQEARLPILTNQECRKKNTRVTPDMVCGGFTTSNGMVSGCMGDSGGPYVCKSGDNWVLHGIVSWGSRRCDAQHLHTVFTRISAYDDWIAARI